MDLWPKWKEHGSMHKLSKIYPKAQNLNIRGILLTREDHIAFLQKKAIHKYIYPKATKSTTIHLMSITSKVITSYLAYHGNQSIWEKHISMAYDTNAVYDTKMQNANMIWYINENATCICTSTLPTESQKGKTTPSSPWKCANVAWSKGLVRISASYFSVGT
jgi:hypothetical protein